VDRLSDVVNDVLDLSTRGPLTIFTCHCGDRGNLLWDVAQQSVNVVDVAFALEDCVALRQSIVHEDLRPVITGDFTNDHIGSISGLSGGGQKENPQRPLYEVVRRRVRLLWNTVGTSKGQLVHPAAFRGSVITPGKE